MLKDLETGKTYMTKKDLDKFRQRLIREFDREMTEDEVDAWLAIIDEVNRRIAEKNRKKRR